MSFSISEFCPTKPKAVLNEMELDFNVLTLASDTLIREDFGELNYVLETFKVNPFRIYDIAWILLDRKDLFNYSPKKFRDFGLKQAVDNSKILYFTINECITKSIPIIKNRKRYEELLKLQAEKNDKPICYGVYYDKIAKRYGYTIEQFMALTLRQLHILLSVSNEQTYEEIEVQAALQGRKLKARMDYKDIEEKEDKRLDDDAKEMLAREMKAYQERQAQK